MRRLLLSDVIDLISKEELIYYYIIENHSQKDCLKHFNIGQGLLNSLLRKYNIRKDKTSSNELSKLTKLERYGDANYNNREKAAQTCLTAYGVDNPFKDTAKIKESYIAHGYTHPMHDTDIKKQCVDNHDYTKLLEKSHETYKSKTGYSNPWSNPDVISKMSCDRNATGNYINLSHTIQTCQSKYGVNFPCQLPQAKVMSSSESIPNIKFSKFLSDNEINFTREFCLGSYSYDFKVGKLLIEINPSATHNSTWGIHGTPLLKDYHYNKTKYAQLNGYRCLHVWDWDNADGIISLLKSRETIGARKCICKNIADKKLVKTFINKNHIQGYSKSDIDIGLYYKDELISIMTFGKPRYNKKYQYELIRYCSCYNVIGGAEKLFHYFVNQYNPMSIISYCDLSKFTGSTYTKLGFKLFSESGPTKHWYNLKTQQHITDNLLRQRGYDQLFHTSYGKGTSNEQLMLDNGFVEVYDCGQATYVWK